MVFILRPGGRGVVSGQPTGPAPEFVINAGGQTSSANLPTFGAYPPGGGWG
jgi:hypothetical protein